MRILIVDDDRFARAGLQRMLRSRFVAATILLATCVQEAIELFDRERPDVLLLDVRLRPEDPFDAGGLDVLRHAKRAGHRGPIFMVSGLDSVELRNAALDARCDPV